MSDLTHVELLWLEKRIENRIRFGHVAEEQNSRPQQARPVIRTRQHLCLRSLDIERFWSGRFPHRHLAGGRNRPTLLDRPLCQTRRRDSLAPVRLAKGRTRAAVDRCRRGARHRPCRRSARLLASRSQPPVRQRNAARLHKVTPSGLAPSAEGRTVTRRKPNACQCMIGAVALLAGAIVAKPFPIYIWNSSESVPLGLYRLQPAERSLRHRTCRRSSRPSRSRPILDRNGYLPSGVPMLKRVLALPGQTVCRTGSTITVDGIEMGEARERDSRGRPLPVWAGLRRRRRWRSSSS